MKKVAFNNIVNVKYYSVNERNKPFLEKFLNIFLILLISLGLLYW